jgi:hypothetical protein
MVFDRQTQPTTVNLVNAGERNHEIFMPCRGSGTGKRARFAGDAVVNVSHHRWAMNVRVQHLSCQSLRTDG